MQEHAPARPGEQIRERRLDQGKSQQTLATQAGISLRTLARIEAGEDMHLGTLRALATALDVPVTDLLEAV